MFAFIKSPNEYFIGFFFGSILDQFDPGLQSVTCPSVKGEATPRMEDKDSVKVKMVKGGICYRNENDKKLSQWNISLRTEELSPGT